VLKFEAIAESGARLKITEARTKTISVPLRGVRWSSAGSGFNGRDFTLLEILTDEKKKGASLMSAHAGSAIRDVVPLMIHGSFKDVLIGEDPFAISRITEKMYKRLGTYAHRASAESIRAIGMVNNALWDLVGKALDAPVYQLLGGYRNRIPCYVTGGYYAKDKRLRELREELNSYVEEGFRAIKMKIGALSVKKDVERVKAARDAIGHDVDLMVDANCCYDASTAIKIGRELEKLDIHWFEEPLPPYDLPGNVKVATALDIPVASGESENSLYGFRNIIQSGGVDIVQADATVVAGISEWLRVAALAKAWNLPLAPHTSPYVHMHLAAAFPEVLIVELLHEQLEAEIFTENLVPEKGYLQLPDKPGLGIEFNEKVIEKYLL
jgi:L-alanine-DL-glutamate epimerase-like enolase superfamily enzyme